MTPTGWILSALAPHDRQTAAALAARIPSTISLTDVTGVLRGLVADGRARWHDPDGGSEATYTRTVSP